MIGYIFETEEEAIAARDKAAKYKGLPTKESKTKYWINYRTLEDGRFWIENVEGLSDVLGEAKKM